MTIFPIGWKKKKNKKSLVAYLGVYIFVLNDASIVPKFVDTMLFGLCILRSLLTVPRNWKRVASFVGDQIKEKEDHLMPLYIFI